MPPCQEPGAAFPFGGFLSCECAAFRGESPSRLRENRGLGKAESGDREAHDEDEGEGLAEQGSHAYVFVAPLKSLFSAPGRSTSVSTQHSCGMPERRLSAQNSSSAFPFWRADGPSLPGVI